jgi:hypothetical protein
MDSAGRRRGVTPVDSEAQVPCSEEKCDRDRVQDHRQESAGNNFVHDRPDAASRSGAVDAHVANLGIPLDHRILRGPPAPMVRSVLLVDQDHHVHIGPLLPHGLAQPVGPEPMHGPPARRQIQRHRP